MSITVKQFVKDAQYHSDQSLYEAARRTVNIIGDMPGHLRVTHSTYSILPDTLKDAMLATLYQMYDREAHCFISVAEERNAILEWIAEHVREYEDTILLYDFAHWYDEYQIRTSGMDNGPEHYVPEDLKPVYENLDNVIAADHDEAMKVDVFSLVFGNIVKNKARQLITESEAYDSMLLLCNDMLTHMMGKVTTPKPYPTGMWDMTK